MQTAIDEATESLEAQKKEFEKKRAATEAHHQNEKSELAVGFGESDDSVSLFFF